MSKKSIILLVSGILLGGGIGAAFYFTNKHSKMVGYVKGQKDGFAEGYDKAEEVYMKCREM